MADQEQRAGVILQQLFEQFEGFDVEVVGGLIEYQHIGRTAEQAREQKTVALTARERFHQRPDPLRRKQKIAQITDDVFSRTIDLDEITTLADGIAEGGIFIQCGTELVEVRDLEFGAQARLPVVGLQLSHDEFQQRGLAGAIGADQADLVPAQQPAGEILDDGPAAIGFGNVLQFRHQFPGTVPLGYRELHLARPIASRSALKPQRLKAAHSAFIAGAPSFDALPDPHFLLGQYLVELPVEHGFCRKRLGFSCLPGREIARIGGKQSAIQFENLVHNLVEESAVVGDAQHAAGEGA